MNEFEVVALVTGTIAAVRDKVPKLDGWPVVVVAAALSAAFGIAIETEMRAELLRSLRIFCESVGSVALLKYGGAKVGEALAKAAPPALVSVRPPPPGEANVVLVSETGAK